MEGKKCPNVGDGDSGLAMGEEAGLYKQSSTKCFNIIVRSWRDERAIAFQTANAKEGPRCKDVVGRARYHQQ